MAPLMSADLDFGNHTRLPMNFTIQSHDINFSEWVALFTLCLTPLAVHIFAGVPEPTVLNGEQPRWHDRLPHLNPTSIFWRYYAITIRRSRTRPGHWKSIDMAATNAVFWKGEESKWDGSENIMIESRNFSTRRPSRNRINFMSASAMKTLLVTIQGIQAMYGLIRGLSLGGYALKVALPNIFLPLALAGLYRLPASLWLTEEYGYKTMPKVDGSIHETNGSIHGVDESITEVNDSTPEVNDSAPEVNGSIHKADGSIHEAKASVPEVDGSLRGVNISIPVVDGSIPEVNSSISEGRGFVSEQLEFADAPDQLYSQKHWRALVVNISFLGTIAVLCALSIYYFKPNPRITSGTASTLTINLFYTTFLFVTLVTATFYTVTGQSNTTIIPCISSPWYKIYTYFLVLFALWLLIASALETRRTSCGEYTTYPAELDLDHFMC